VPDVTGEVSLRMRKDWSILVVDDDARVRLVLKNGLERMGECYHVETAVDGRDALEKVKARDYDLVMTDLRMPGMDGFELTERVRALDSKTKVIWVTAYGCYKAADQAGRLCVHCCLDKPLRISKVREAAIEALEEIEG
jgi:DNA-binding NtrC family response regulator